jgi:hypothetical protein
MITDPQAIRFANEQVRPLCERARALKAEIDAMTTTWFGGVNNLFPNDSTALDDGREAEGVSRLTGAQVNSAVGQLIGIAPNAEIISAPCVRPLSAS